MSDRFAVERQLMAGVGVMRLAQVDPSPSFAESTVNDSFRASVCYASVRMNVLLPSAM